jgi:hypothetical protein
MANSRNPSAFTLIKENLSLAERAAAINDDTIPYHCGGFRVGPSDPGDRNGVRGHAKQSASYGELALAGAVIANGRAISTQGSTSDEAPATSLDRRGGPLITDYGDSLVVSQFEL